MKVNHEKDIDKKYLSKIKLLLPVYFKIAFTSLVSISLARLLFSSDVVHVEINEAIWELWLPIIVPGALILFWLTPRYKNIKAEWESHGKVGDFSFFMQMVTWLSLLATLNCIEEYVTTSSGRMITVEKTSEISEHSPQRYYKINHFSVSNDSYRLYSHVYRSGRYDETINFNIYFAFQILDSEWDTIHNKKFWYCIVYRYNEHAGNQESIETDYKTYYDECLFKLKSYVFHSLDHFERIPPSDSKRYFIKAINEYDHLNESELVLLRPIQEKYELRNGKSLQWAALWFGLGTVFYFIALAWPGVVIVKYKKRKSDLTFRDVVKMLIPRDEHFATSLLIDINIVVFLIMIFSGVHPVDPDTVDLLRWGGIRGVEVHQGDWWRLVTYQFIHAGFHHLILNMVGLAIAAILIEPLLGKTRMMILYLTSGICAGLASLYWHTNSVGIGASGAIFGLYGGIFAINLLTNRRKGHEIYDPSIIGLLVLYIGTNLALGIFGNADNAAHIGGLLSGAVIALILFINHGPHDEGIENG